MGLHLRPIHEGDALGFQEIHEKMSERGQYYAFLRALENESKKKEVGALFVRRRLQQYSEGIEAPSILSLCICTHDSKPIGSLSAVFHAPNNWPHAANKNLCELECFVSPESQGRGVAYQSVLLFMELIKDRFMIDRFLATTHHQNIASKRIIEKVGMVYLAETTLKTDIQFPARQLFVTKNCLDLIEI